MKQTFNNFSDLQLVYSTEGEIKKKTVNQPNDLPNNLLELHFSSKGRGGKVVTIIKGVIGSGDSLKALAKELKRQCGVGGSVKNREIIIQGDCRDGLMKILKEKGFRVKRVGG